MPVKVTIQSTQGPAIAVKPPTIVDPLRPPATPPVAPPVRPPEPPIATNTPPVAPPTVRPAEPPVLVRPPGDAPQKPPVADGNQGTRIISGLTPARDKAIEFIAANCAMGKDHEMVARYTENLDKALTKGQDIKFVVGGRLLKSGLTTLVFVQHGRCYVVELSLKQAAQLGAADGTMGVEFANPYQEVRGKPTVEIAAPLLLSPQPISTSEKTEWGFHFLRIDPPSDRPYSIRLRYRAGQNGTLTAFTFREPPAMGNVRNRVDLPAMSDVTRAMPVMLFFDICHMPDDFDKGKAEVLSETFGVLVDVAPK